ncbi:MAG: DUF748 domain-containing protein [Candidatus Omnitrophica bacterium]|nr:DUF748 domain-containing protein [Candidatus Omnitrophota bacterium]
MKWIAKLLLIMFILVVVGYGAIFVFVNTKGKDILIKNVEDNLGLAPQVNSLSLKFPFNVEIKNFLCGDLSFNKASISLGLFNPFVGELVLDKVSLDGFTFKIQKDKEKIALRPFFVKKSHQLEQETAVQQKLPASTSQVKNTSSSKKKQVSLKIRNLYLKNGSLEMVDLTKDEPISIILKDISGELNDFSYPQLTKFYIKLNSSLNAEGIEIKDALSASGWVDYANKNMEANFNINNVDYSAFSAYYPQSFKPESLGVKKALLSLDADLNAQSNDLIIDCILSLEKIEYAQLKEGEKTSGMKTLKTVLGLLKAGKDKPVFQLRIKTKMDSPGVDLSSIKDDFREEVRFGPGAIVGQILGKGTEAIFEGVKGTKKISLDAAVDTLKDIVDTFGEAFEPNSADTPPDVDASQNETETTE